LMASRLASTQAVAGAERRAGRAGGGSSAVKATRLAIKAWANDRYPGICADRGRLAHDLEAAYHNGQDQAALDAYAKVRGYTKPAAAPKAAKPEPVAAPKAVKPEPVTTNARKPATPKSPAASAVSPVDFSDPTGPTSPEEPKRSTQAANRGGPRKRTAKIS
jgi:hypothetical protein